MLYSQSMAPMQKGALINGLDFDLRASTLYSYELVFRKVYVHHF